ncbi:sensor histidine kinase [Duganella ginsengisoli]|uniref:Sensor histidine kinase n=2 Tax=Pseudoduganella ginsengisoli TaxID=1462440 RepID=A0A6L6Q983_9BURK|nr:sensor histidine kinase [Pseudoduganella ginsengisoli]
MTRTHWYWLLQILGWSAVVVFVAFANSRYLYQHGAIAICVLCGICGLVLSDLAHRLYKARRWHVQPAAWRIIAFTIVVLGPLQTAGTMATNYLIIGKNGDLNWLHMLLTFWTGIMLAWAICYLAYLYLRRANRFEAEALRLEVLAKDAELRALQAQVNPHFFFNSLNSVRALIYENQDSAAQMIDQLATLMRYTLQSSYADTVPLSEELEAVQSYLAIEKIRFEERLRLALDIAGGMETVRIPPMALQTLVENAVKYGVEQSATGTEIRISASHANGKATIEVSNQGALRTFSNSTSVGLSNARKRLILSKGDSASLDLVERDGWVRATLHFPLAA